MAKLSTIHDPRFEAMIKILKDARLKLGITQEELSARLGQHRIFITKVESGDRRLDVVELYELCQALNISIYTLIESTLDKNSSTVMEDNPEYILGFSNGYIQGRGYEGDKNVSGRVFKESAKLLNKGTKGQRNKKDEPA